MNEKFARLCRSPLPLRWILTRFLDSRMDFLKYEAKLAFESIARPHYGRCLMHAARLAKKLGHDRIAAIEFGVAGGNGLLALEMHADRVARETGVSVVPYGFDTGTGMPSPTDFRDLPYLWQPGSFGMDVERLRAKLRSAKLVLGPVEETVRGFCELENPPPIGFISFDLDYYSSTRSALNVLVLPHSYLLPRVACYFDDMVGDIDYAFKITPVNCWLFVSSTIPKGTLRSPRFGGCGFSTDKCRGYGMSRSSWLTFSLTPTTVVQ